MRKIAALIMPFLCLYAVASCTKEEPDDSFKSKMSELYGSYKLYDIDVWARSINLNDDNTSSSDSMMEEFKNKIGYYEPDYTANVNDGAVFSPNFDKISATAFNVTVPYPYYVVVDGVWKCTEIRSFKLTIRATEDSFQLRTNSCFVYPGFNNPDDVFLSNVKDISLVVYSYESDHFEICLHCTLPFVFSRLDDIRLEENYLYYYYSK